MKKQKENSTYGTSTSYLISSCENSWRGPLRLWNSFIKSEKLTPMMSSGRPQFGLRNSLCFLQRAHYKLKHIVTKSLLFTRQEKSDKGSYKVALWEMYVARVYGCVWVCILLYLNFLFWMKVWSLSQLVAEHNSQHGAFKRLDKWVLGGWVITGLISSSVLHVIPPFSFPTCLSLITILNAEMQNAFKCPQPNNK